MAHPRPTNFADLTAAPVNTAPTAGRAPGPTTPAAPTTPSTPATGPQGRTQAQWLLDLLNAGTAPQQAIDTLNQYGQGFQGAAYYNDARGQTIGLNSVNGYLNRKPDASWELVMRPYAEAGGGGTPANSFASLLGGGLTPSPGFQLPGGLWSPQTPIQFGSMPTPPPQPSPLPTPGGGTGAPPWWIQLGGMASPWWTQPGGGTSPPVPPPSGPGLYPIPFPQPPYWTGQSPYPGY